MGIDKCFTEIDEQYRIQKSRNLCIDDESTFKEYLLAHNYFEIINGFESLLLKDVEHKDVGYKEGTSFEDFLRLYDFESDLNVQIMKTLMYFEKKLKARISYHFSEAYCTTIPNTLNYMNKSFYDCPAVTSYGGKYFSKQFNNDSFAFFSKYNIFFKQDPLGTLSYADTKKNIVYVGAFNNPPLWVIIKQLTLNDIYIMTGLLKKTVIEKVLLGFGLTTGDRDYFLNCINIFKELRNDCAHFELVNRFRTGGDLSLKLVKKKHAINPTRINLRGEATRIGLFDTLLVLSSFSDVKGVVDCIVSYIDKNTELGKNDLSKQLLDRMGCANIVDLKALA